MSYKSCFVQPLKENNYRVHLWDDGGYQTMAWNYHAYVECDDHDANKNIRGLRQESLRKVNKWEKFNFTLPSYFVLFWPLVQQNHVQGQFIIQLFFKKLYLLI